MKKKREDAKKTSGDFINQLKQDLEKVNEQLDTELNKEKHRQLTNMQQQMAQRLKLAEELFKQEEAEAILEEEKERKEKEEAERLKREELERVETLRV